MVLILKYLRHSGKEKVSKSMPANKCVKLGQIPRKENGDLKAQQSVGQTNLLETLSLKQYNKLVQNLWFASKPEWFIDPSRMQL